MTWWQALILGIVEGLTEYLPISSTGHLILTQWLLGLDVDPVTENAVDQFNIVIQAGAIAAVLGLYWRRIRQMLDGLLGKNPAGRRLLINLIVAFIPAALLGPLLADRIQANLFAPWPVIAALFVGSWLMIAVAHNPVVARARDEGKDIDTITVWTALLIGFGQCIAMWPGTSRSMMTIVAALLLGMRARAAAEFSFLLGLVTLSAATAYAGMKGGWHMIDTLGNGSTGYGMVILAIGFITAAISAAAAIKWFVGFLNRYGLAPFGWYRLLLASVLALLILSGLMQGFGSAAPDATPQPAPAAAAQ